MEKILQPYESPENTKLNAALSVLTVKLLESPWISFPLPATVNAVSYTHLTLPTIRSV